MKEGAEYGLILHCIFSFTKVTDRYGNKREELLKKLYIFVYHRVNK